MSATGLILGGAVVMAAGFSHRYAWWRKEVPYRYPRILMYHMVRAPIPGSRTNGLRVPPAMFERQLAWLKDNGWTHFTMAELMAAGDDLPEKAVAITFDDGYGDNLYNALPLLEKYDARATLYLVVNRHGNDWSASKKAHHAGSDLIAEPKLSDAEVLTMVASGRIELAAHTLTHPNFARATVRDKREQLSRCKALLEKHFNVPVTSFAYPFGIYSQDDVALVREAGYSNAVTVEPGIDTEASPDPLQLKRVKVSGKENMLAFKIRMRTGRRGFNK